ncbi:MAG: SRPBCC family protein [Thermoleophilia bacterium]|nr:SRPBCC family protein [Thermoleophilia bacterium]
MPEVVTSEEFETPADRVWDFIAGFDTLPDYHAAVEASVLSKGGAERRLTMTDEAGGGTVVERLMSFDDERRTFGYRILELIDCPLPFADYQAHVQVEETSPATCKVHWGSTFKTVGATDDEAVAIAQAIYQGCYDGIRRTLELPAHTSAGESP